MDLSGNRSAFLASIDHFLDIKKKKRKGTVIVIILFCFVFVFISRKIVPVQNNKHESPTTHTHKKIAKQN